MKQFLFLTNSLSWEGGSTVVLTSGSVPGNVVPQLLVMVWAGAEEREWEGHAGLGGFLERVALELSSLSRCTNVRGGIAHGWSKKTA